MTDKQIIIDDVGVSGCEFFETKAQVMQCHRGALTQRCKANNCHYKQLKAELEVEKDWHKTADEISKANSEYTRKLKQAIEKIKDYCNKYPQNSIGFKQQILQISDEVTNDLENN